MNIYGSWIFRNFSFLMYLSYLPEFLQAFGNTFFHDSSWSIIGQRIFISSKQFSSIFMRSPLRVIDYNIS